MGGKKRKNNPPEKPTKQNPTDVWKVSSVLPWEQRPGKTVPHIRQPLFSCFVLAQEVLAQDTQVKEGKNSALGTAVLRHLMSQKMIPPMDLVHKWRSHPAHKRDFCLYLLLTDAGYSEHD